MEFRKPSLATIFFIVGLISLWFISSKNLDVSKFIPIISLVLLAFPISLLGIFAIPKVRKSVREYYKKERKEINLEIAGLRKEQESLEDPEKIIKIDEEILEIRKTLLGVNNKRFEQDIVWAIVLLALTAAIFYLDLGVYIDTSSQILGTVCFFFGAYRIAEMIETLFICFEK